MKKFILFALAAGTLAAGAAVHAQVTQLPYHIRQDANGAQYYYDQWGGRHYLNSPYGTSPYGVPYAYSTPRGWSPYAPGVVNPGGGGDRDGDGVRNRYDRDRDGDGVVNRHDRRPNNPNRR